jgi:hypothetical protein
VQNPLIFVGFLCRASGRHASSVFDEGEESDPT